MKRRELERKLSELGWKFLRAGGKHDVWWNGKEDGAAEYIPRHKEIGEGLAAKVLKTAKEEPGED